MTHEMPGKTGGRFQHKCTPFVQNVESLLGPHCFLAYTHPFHMYCGLWRPVGKGFSGWGRSPDSHLVHVKDLYTAEELKTSPTYNEILLRSQYQNGLNVRLDGPDTSHISWGLGDPVASDDWGSSEIATIKRLLPHIRQFIRVRQALVRAEAHETTVTALLDNPRIGVLHLERRGQIIAVNDRARSILRHGDGLSDRDGVLLGARKAADQLRLERLVACRATGRWRHRSQRVDAAGPLVRVHRHSWCTSNPSLFHNRTTERGMSPRWS